MNRLKTTTILAAVVMLLAGGAMARANSEDLLVVKVPFPFVAEGRTMPAGQYVVQREDLNSPVLLLLGEHGNRVGTFVSTIPAGGHDPKGSTPVLQFTRQGKRLVLTSIWEGPTEGERLVY